VIGLDDEAAGGGSVPDANDNHGASACEPNTTVSLRPSRSWLAPPANQPSLAADPVTERSWVTEATRPRARGSTAGIDSNIGTVIGSYRLLSRIGQGGMSQVYVAEHTRLGRRVAVKVLRSELSRRPTAVTRFLREARIASRIRHVNIVQLEDLIEPESGPPCLVMELLAGRSLRDILRISRVVAPALVLDIGIQVASALEAIHAEGVLHRDLTPGNIFLCDDRETPDGWIKLLDFGAAKMFTIPSSARLGPVRDEHVTAEGTIIGTPGYMSPEQAGGTLIDARTDLYSLGVLLYELVSGEPLIRGKTFDECVRAHITDTPRDLQLTERGKSAPPALTALIMRCLARDPAARPTSAAMLRGELLALRAGSAPPRSLRRALRLPLIAAATAALIAAIAHAAPVSIRAGLGSTGNMLDVAGALWLRSLDAGAPPPAIDAGVDHQAVPPDQAAPAPPPDPPPAP
jgi:serine/threonine protein kinase